jgi:hypothetical protein
MNRLVLLVATLFAVALTFAFPSGAVVHEIVAQWCSGHPELEPPGLADPSESNFARPLIASGAATIVPNFDGLGHTLIRFDFDKPSLKIVSAGAPVPLFGDTWITPWTTDDNFAAFQNCPGFVGGSLP